MKYKLDKELIKAIRESDNEEIRLEINDDKIELVENNKEFKIGDKYYYTLFNLGPMCHGVTSKSINQEESIKTIKKEKSFKRFHTKTEALKYADWLDIRVVIEGVIDELGRPTKEDIDNENLELYYCYSMYESEYIKIHYNTTGYEQPFLCKEPFLDQIKRKIGIKKVKFFYKNMWRFL